MENNENLVTEEVVTENVEQTTEETQPAVKTYTQEEVDDIVGKAKYRAKENVRKEYARKYGRLENVLKAGTGKETVEEMADTFADFYRGKGFDIPEEPTYSARDVEILANAEADEIIKSGFDEAVEEADRLNDIGAENMTPREKTVFLKLTSYIKDTETGRELSKIGVKEDVYGSEEFKNFASMFDSKTPKTKIYELFAKTQPKKEFKNPGSMKTTAQDDGIKDFYTPEEARRFTVEDFNKNPTLFQRVQESMSKWTK